MGLYFLVTRTDIGEEKVAPNDISCACVEDFCVILYAIYIYIYL